MKWRGFLWYPLKKFAVCLSVCLYVPQQFPDDNLRIDQWILFKLSRIVKYYIYNKLSSIFSIIPNVVYKLCNFQQLAISFFYIMWLGIPNCFINAYYAYSLKHVWYIFVALHPVHSRYPFNCMHFHICIHVYIYTYMYATIKVWWTRLIPCIL